MLLVSVAAVALAGVVGRGQVMRAVAWVAQLSLLAASDMAGRAWPCQALSRVFLV